MEKKQKTKLYQKWWFWLCIILIDCVIGGTIALTNNESIPTTSNNNDTDTKINNYLNNLKENYNNKKLKENPYKLTNNFDGVYSFNMNSDNGSGYIFNAKGVISFNNGICKVKYNNNREYEGYCGLNEEDNLIFYFTLNDDANYATKTFKAVLNEKNLNCELLEGSDFNGNYSNKELELIFMSNVIDINTAYTQFKKEQQKQEEAEKKAKAEQEEKDFKASCEAYTYEQIARNPDNFKGTNVKLTGEVIQALYSDGSVDLRVNITKTGTYSTYYTDTVYVVYYPEDGEDKILEDDIITIYGVSMGDYTYTSALGSPVTLPLIAGKYITINQ